MTVWKPLSSGVAVQFPLVLTDAEFTAQNPVLALKRLGIASDLGYVKYGDGVTAWNSLDGTVVVKSVRSPASLGGTVRLLPEAAGTIDGEVINSNDKLIIGNPLISDQLDVSLTTGVVTATGGFLASTPGYAGGPKKPNAAGPQGSGITDGAVYSFLNPGLGAVGDRMMVSGGSFQTIFSYAERTAATQITLYGLNVNTGNPTTLVVVSGGVGIQPGGYSLNW